MDRTKRVLLRFRRLEYRDLAPLMLSSNAFFRLWRAIGDGFDVTSGQVEGCPTCGALDDECLAIAVALAHELPQCTVFKSYHGVDAPNVNFDKRMDSLCRSDECIIRHIAQDLCVSPEDSVRAKSGSLLRLAVAKAASFPQGVATVPGENGEGY
jgi:hypothetical protein